MPKGQCSTDPVSGVAGDLWNAWKGNSNAGLDPSVLSSGSTIRKLVAAQIEAVAETIVNNQAAGSGAPTTSTVTPNAIAGSSSIGSVSSESARADHTHAHGSLAGGSLHAQAVAGVSDGFLSASDKSKLDGVAASATNTPLSSTTPAALGSAAVGVGTTAARADHAHAMPTASQVGAPATSLTLTAGAGLTGGGDLSANRTFAVGANADGSITVNADDIQVGVLATDAQHGSRGGGTLHAAATSLADGFLSKSDKSKLDGIATSATNTPLTSTAPADIQKQTASAGTGTEAARVDHKHQVQTAAAVSCTPGGSSTEGTATTLARSDHTHALPAYGTTAGTICQGNDARVTGAVQTSRQIIAGTGLTGGGDLSADRTLTVAYGTSGTTACAGNDTRLSNRQEVSGTVQTTNATVTTIATVAIPTSSCVLIEVYVVGVQSASGATAGGYIITGTYRNQAGTVSLVGTLTATYTAETTSTWNATFTISGTNVLVQVTGVAATTINWKCRGEALSVT